MACADCGNTLEKIAQTSTLTKRKGFKELKEKGFGLYTVFKQCSECLSVYEDRRKVENGRLSIGGIRTLLKKYEGKLAPEELKRYAIQFKGFITKAEESAIIKDIILRRRTL